MPRRTSSRIRSDPAQGIRMFPPHLIKVRLHCPLFTEIVSERSNTKCPSAPCPSLSEIGLKACSWYLLGDRPMESGSHNVTDTQRSTDALLISKYR